MSCALFCTMALGHLIVRVVSPQRGLRCHGEDSAGWC